MKIKTTEEKLNILLNAWKILFQKLPSTFIWEYTSDRDKDAEQDVVNAENYMLKIHKENTWIFENEENNNK